MKYVLFVLLGVVLLGGIWFSRQEIENSAEERIATAPTASIKGNELNIEIARTLEEQTRGLSGREQNEENAGMLFVYERSVLPGFWMLDMNFAIDIIWIDKNQKIVGITENVAPETYPEVFRPPSPVLYVLEVNAGWANERGISAGDKVFLNNVF